MKLETLRIKGYKCFKDSQDIPFHNLTIFIGENDSGKSTVLSALEILLLNKQINDEDYHRDVESGKALETIEIIGIFKPNVEMESAIIPYIVEGKIYLKKIINKTEGIKFYVKKEVYEDERLSQIEKLLVPNLKEIATELGINENQRKDDLKNEILNFIKNSPQATTIKEVEVQWKEIANHIPIFQKYSSSDYGNPQVSVAKALQNVYRSHFYEKDENGNENPKQEFSDLKTNIENSLNSKIEDSLKSKIQKYNPNIVDVKGRFNIDFAKGLEFYQLEIDTGSGLKPILSRGEGARKRLFLAILEWDKEIERETQSSRGLIKAYDEPDANLHFEAQRRLFYEISKDNSEHGIVQNIICTHSLTMIDRAPTHCINRLTTNEFEQSEISYLLTDDDNDIKTFLNHISEIGGIKNSSIFYERCFLLVEGASEENAIPVLYKKYTGKTLLEDGIVLINLQSNGAWQNFLKLLSKNKQHCTLLFLDSDTQYNTSSAQITPDRLTEIGFKSSFLNDNVIFVGTKEFEDTYPDYTLAEMLNQHYPKADSNVWTNSEISNLKSNSQKFSEEILIHIGRCHRNRASKPEVALKFANFIANEDIAQMQEVVSLFEKVKGIVS